MFYSVPNQAIERTSDGVVGRGLKVGEDGGASVRETDAVDQTGVGETVAVDEVVGPKQCGQDPDVELVTAGKEDGVVGSCEGSETSFESTMVVGVAGDQA